MKRLLRFALALGVLFATLTPSAETLLQKLASHGEHGLSAAEGYALGILATEHLKARDLVAAIEELQQATMLLPGKAALHSNLAYALGLNGRPAEALKEARMALKLDPGRSKVRLVLA